MTQAAMDNDTMVAVTPEDRALVYSLLIPAAHTELQKLALEYIRDGKSDDCDAVQSVARHRIQSEGRTEAADEIASLRARVEAAEDELTETVEHLEAVLFSDPGPKMLASIGAARAWWMKRDAREEAQALKDSDNAE